MLCIIIMHRWNYDYKEIQSNRDTYKRTLRVKPLPKDVIGCEDPIWYDGIFCYQTPDWKRYSTRAHIPLEKNEMCAYWMIFKVEKVDDWEWEFNYHYDILSSRPDNAE